jgi:hypothetical protein
MSPDLTPIPLENKEEISAAEHHDAYSDALNMRTIGNSYVEYQKPPYGPVIPPAPVANSLKSFGTSQP